MATELQAEAAIRTDDITAAHEAMVVAAQSAGYSLRPAGPFRIPGHDCRRDTEDFLYQLSGPGPQDGAHLRLFHPKGALVYRLMITQDVVLHENQIGNALATMWRFLRNVEDVVSGAVGATIKGIHEPRVRHEATVEKADGTHVTTGSRVSSAALSRMLDEEIARRMAEAPDGTALIVRTISPLGDQSISRHIKVGSRVVVDAEGRRSVRHLHVGGARPHMEAPQPAVAPNVSVPSSAAVSEPALG